MDRSYMEAITGSEGPQTPTVPLSLGQVEFISLLPLFLSLTLSLSLSKLLAYESQQRGKVKHLFFLLGKKTAHIF